MRVLSVRYTAVHWYNNIIIFIYVRITYFQIVSRVIKYKKK